MELIKFMFSGFWIFIGCAIMLTGLANTILIIWQSFWRHLSIRKHGWPPEYTEREEI